MKQKKEGIVSLPTILTFEEKNKFYKDLFKLFPEYRKKHWNII